jgi:fumarate hydratase subunit beta
MKAGLVSIAKNIKPVNTPLNNKQIMNLKAGDIVHISGWIFTARDSANQKFSQLIKNGDDLPLELKEQIIFYASPTPAKPGWALGSIGPTSSYRMDPYTPLLLDHGLKGMIGKGSRSEKVIESIKKNIAVYFVVIGGTAALIARSVKKCREIICKDLIGETIYQLYVEKLEVIVAIDCFGMNIYDIGPAKYKESLIHN